MGQTGSQPAGAAPQRTRRAHTLPHEPLRHAPKVLPSLTESPRLRSTDNGVILHAGGTISGRRPASTLQEIRPPQGHVHTNVYRSRSAGAPGEPGELRARERDPLHRSHTNLDLRHAENGNFNKRFGSEPNLRVEEEQQKPRNNTKHFRKKYRAPPPPTLDTREGSSPESSDVNARSEPQRKLRLFKTRNETKHVNDHREPKAPVYRSIQCEYKSLDCYDNPAFERRYKSPYKDKEPHCHENREMIQSSASQKREEHLIQPKQDHRKQRTDKFNGYRGKMIKPNKEHIEARKTPLLLNKNFRHSERFKKEDFEVPALRREKTFNDIHANNDHEISPRAVHQSQMKAIGEQLKNKKLNPSPALGKSLPSLLPQNTEEKDEFQRELKKATSRIRDDLGNNDNIRESQTSHNKTNVWKPNPTKNTTQNKVKESSLTNNMNHNQNLKIPNSRRPLSRINESKPKTPINQKAAIKNGSIPVINDKFIGKENGQFISDRGQASGKESTPERSPTRQTTETKTSSETQKSTPSKQFYFGMNENEKANTKDRLKDFPGLGTPIIEEYSNFHLIEKKLLSYHEEETEFEKFNAKLKRDLKIKNISSESALSSDDGSEGDDSGASIRIAVRLRPTPPKKQPPVITFSPEQAWRQLASLDAHLASQTQPLAVETKVSSDVSPESSPRSEQSIDKSGDSGISGDHANSDNRIESPSRHHMPDPNPTWTPQQDLGDSSSDGAGGAMPMHPSTGLVTYNPGAQPFSLSLPRENQDKFKGMSCFYDCFQGKQLQQGFNSLQKLRKSVSGALGAALGSRRFDLEHEPMLEEPEQNWFLSKSAPNSLSNPLLYQQPSRGKGSTEEVIKEETPEPFLEKEPLSSWRPSNSYLSWGGHVMYLPPGPNTLEQPLSMLGPLDRPVRSKSSGSLEVSARAARAAALAGEMREKERSASPDVARALPARVEPVNNRNGNIRSRGKRFTFQSTVRQLERRKLAEKLSKEADLKEQQRKTELEAMRRVEEEFQRKRAREKASIRQQLRLVSGASSMPHNIQHTKSRDEPDGSCRDSPAPARSRDGRQRHSNASSEISGRSKSTTPVRCVELSEWRIDNEARVYRDWAPAGSAGSGSGGAAGTSLPAHAHPPACARMPIATHATYNAAAEVEAFSGSPRSDNYRLEFARGRSPRTPRAPRLLSAARTPSTSSSELSMRQPIKIRDETKEEVAKPAIVPTIRPTAPARASVFIH